MGRFDNNNWNQKSFCIFKGDCEEPEVRSKRAWSGLRPLWTLKTHKPMLPCQDKAPQWWQTVGPRTQTEDARNDRRKEQIQIKVREKTARAQKVRPFFLTALLRFNLQTVFLNTNKNISEARKLFQPMPLHLKFRKMYFIIIKNTQQKRSWLNPTESN